MSEFVTSFRKGELGREIARRGLSQREFALKAGVDKDTITAANQGKRLHATTWGKIIRALGAIPPAEIPAGLAEQAV